MHKYKALDCTYHTTNTQPTKQTRPLSSTKINIHGAGEEDSAECKSGAEEIVACEEGGGVLWVGHGYVGLDGK